MKTLFTLLLVAITTFSSCQMNKFLLEDEVSQYIRKNYNGMDIEVETFKISPERIKLQGQPEKTANEVYIIKFSFTGEDRNAIEPVIYHGIAGFYQQHIYPIDEDAHKFFHFNRTEQPFVVDKDSLRAFVNRRANVPPMVTLLNTKVTIN